MYSITLVTESIRSVFFLRVVDLLHPGRQRVEPAAIAPTSSAFLGVTWKEAGSGLRRQVLGRAPGYLASICLSASSFEMKMTVFVSGSVRASRALR